MSFSPNQYTFGQTSVAQRGVMQQVYAWMTAGLLTTGAVAFFAANSGITESLARTPLLFFGLFIAQIAVVWFLSARISRMAPAAAIGTFLGYSMLSGLTLSPILFAYTSQSIASTFFVTGGTFGVMSAFGYLTKADLSKMGSILFMALIGFLIASVVNIFLASSALYWILTYAGIAIFVGLTAWDTQKIKRMSMNVTNETDAQRVGIIGALTLYLDFINLFLLLLRILGDRR